MTKNMPGILELCNVHNSRICCGRDDTTRRKFWMVYVDGTRGSERKFKTLDDADQEARRLAEKESGKAVYILESTDGYVFPRTAPEKFSTRAYE